MPLVVEPGLLIGDEFWFETVYSWHHRETFSSLFLFAKSNPQWDQPNGPTNAKKSRFKRPLLKRGHSLSEKPTDCP